MKKRTLFLALATVVCQLNIALAQEPPRPDRVRLAVQPRGSNVELSWPGSVQAADGQMAQPFYELQRSTDLKLWEPLGERLHAISAGAEEPLQVTLPADQSRAFFRLMTSLPRTNLALATTGAEVFGYGAAFGQELQRIGQISPEEFAAMFPSGANYVPGISWNPTNAQFWDQFNADPAVANLGKTWGDPGYRTFDFRLNRQELAVFTNQGFVASERLGSGSFADVFYKVWENDLPVFISTDAILQAWHRTYDAMLEELEETYLFHSAEKILAGMAGQISAASTEVGNGVLHESLLDADYLLTVARSLLAEGNGPVASVLGQDARVATTLADIQAEVMKPVELFGPPCRVVDFSQFKVRGHYTHTERLGRYFRCMMWLGRTDFAVAGGPIDRGCGSSFPAPRELGGAIVLWNLLQRSGEFNTWLNFDRVIQSFIGWADSLNFAQLGGVLAGAGIRTLADVPDLATLAMLQTNILGGDLGVQNIRSDYFNSPLGPEQIQLPRSFLVFGQKFLPDSWAFSQTVFDNIMWDGEKVGRRVPSALDAAFTVLGNNQVVPDLVARITNTAAANSTNHAERWRDGLPYQHNLAAARAVIDAQEPAAWANNIYLGWLAALRELSAPTTDSIYPEAMRTRAWSMKTLNTQLASWTQLRHDTILYAKQSYAGGSQCFYPAGFVEPRVAFWQRLRATVLRTTELISALPYEGTYRPAVWEWQFDPVTGNWNLIRTTNSISLSVIQSNQVAHLRHFADTLATLQTLSEKELAQQCFNPDEELFIRNLVQVTDWLPFGCDGVRRFDGWYPRLFYKGVQFFTGSEDDPAYFQENFGVNAADQIVADVHTDVPCDTCGDPGGVLHEGIGQVNLLLIAVENGADRMVFAGPVLSHYEFEVTGSPRRLNDDEWRAMQWWQQFPPDVDPARVEGVAPPRWTSSYLVRR
jgi:hypothetical protein